MIRMRHLFTRLIIVGLVLLAAWFARESIAKRLLVHQATNFVGAVVEVKQLQFNPDDGSVYLDGLEVSNPQSPRSNLVQAEAAHLEIADEEIAWRRLVIPKARLSQVKFGAPRATSGSLDPEPVVVPGGEEEPEEAFDESDLNQMGQFSQLFKDSLKVDLEKQQSDPGFEINSLVDQLVPKWETGVRNESEALATVEAKIDSANALLNRHEKIRNPLREFDRTLDAAKMLESCREGLASVTERLTQLQETARSDKELLSATQIRDRQRIMATGSSQEFDGHLLSQLLVSKLEQKLVEESLTWFRQFRDGIPMPQQEFGRIKRGRDIHFDGEPRPAVVINQCEIDGDGLFGSHRFQFAGTVNNISSRPETNDHPVTFELFAHGPSQLRINGTLDRRERTRVPLDRIELVGSGMEQPPETLGESDSLLVSMAGGSLLHVDARIQGKGEEITGEIEFTFDNVALHVDQVITAAGGREVAVRVNETLSSINTFRITSTLGGTTLQPETQFVSTLGPRTAGAMEGIFADAIQMSAKKREVAFQNQVEARVTEISLGLTTKIQELTQQKNQLAKKLQEVNERLRVARDPLRIRRNLK